MTATKQNDHGLVVIRQISNGLHNTATEGFVAEGFSLIRDRS